MEDSVAWVLEVAVKAGQLDSYKALMEEMVEATKANEPGTVAYNWFISADGATVHIYEAYVDSAATVAHLGNFGANYAERFMAAVDPVSFTVYGNPSDDVRAALDPMGASYLASWGGFSR